VFCIHSSLLQREPTDIIKKERGEKSKGNVVKGNKTKSSAADPYAVEGIHFTSIRLTTLKKKKNNNNNTLNNMHRHFLVDVCE
jgi:hypothetical protein